jgi:hypothetical protein
VSGTPCFVDSFNIQTSNMMQDVVEHGFVLRFRREKMAVVLPIWAISICSIHQEANNIEGSL